MVEVAAALASQPAPSLASTSHHLLCSFHATLSSCLVQGNVTGVAAGGHSLAVTAQGAIYTWGRNDSKGGGGGGSPGIAASGQLGGFYRAAVPATTPGRVGTS